MHHGGHVADGPDELPVEPALLPQIGEDPQHALVRQNAGQRQRVQVPNHFVPLTDLLKRGLVAGQRQRRP